MGGSGTRGSAGRTAGTSCTNTRSRRVFCLGEAGCPEGATLAEQIFDLRLRGGREAGNLSGARQTDVRSGGWRILMFQSLKNG